MGARLTCALCLLIPLTVFAQAPEAVPAAPASPFDGLIISELNVSGLKQIQEGYVRNQMRTRAGQAYSQDQVQRDVSRLLRTARFVNVRAEPKLVNGQIQLTIVVTEKPEIASIEFVGAVKLKPKDLKATLTFAEGDPLDEYEVRQGREAIEKKYKEAGYSYVEVTYDAPLLEKEHRVVYTIVENQRVKVRTIEVEGNVTYSDNELKHQISTKSHIWIFRKGDFDAERAGRDAITVQQYYRDRGFLDAEVSYVPEFMDVAREQLRLIFRVNEGTRYTVRNIQFEGNTVFTSEELQERMGLKTGDHFNNIRLGTDVTNLQTKYGSVGYIEAELGRSWLFATEPGQVVVTITIKEGEQFQVGFIEVNGNFRTQEKVVRRELRFFPEEIYDITKLRTAENRLKETNLFSEARIETTGTQKGVRDALVTVEENPKTNQFIAGIGASSDNGIVGNIMLENTNFDLFDRPRTWEEFFRGRAYRGAGQTMRVQLEPGTKMNRFRVDFREPYFLNKPIGLNTSVYLFERGRDGYDEKRAGSEFSFDRRFEQGLLKNWTGEIAFRTEYVTVTHRKAFAAKDIRDVEGGNYLSSIKLSMAHDTTDSRFEPSTGHRFEMNYEQAGAMGGDFFYGKVTASGTQHWTVAVDEQDRKSVVTLRANAGQILGDAPVFERFYAGGIGSFRGFDFRGISPRQGLRHNRVGGDFSLLTGAEYSFPLFSKVVRGVFFTDMGTVEKDFGITSWRAAVGGGVRLTVDILGKVPMEFDLAYPIAHDSEDNTRIFSFFIGLPFF